MVDMYNLMKTRTWSGIVGIILTIMGVLYAVMGIFAAMNLSDLPMMGETAAIINLIISLICAAIFIIMGIKLLGARKYANQMIQSGVVSPEPLNKMIACTNGYLQIQGILLIIAIVLMVIGILLMVFFMSSLMNMRML